MDNPPAVTRRTVALGAVWTVPVVAVAAVVPEASASAADCTAVTVTASCTTTSGQSRFCLSSSRPIQSGSRFGFSSSISAISDPTLTVDFSGLAPYLLASGSAASGYTLTAASTIPAGTQLCFTARVTGGYVYTVTNTLNTLNVNGGSNCVGGAPSDTTRITGSFLGGVSCSA